jgi:hypothetical protein
MDSKLTKKTFSKKSLPHVCFCGEPVREFTINKEGARKGEKMESCGTALWNSETREKFGGCSYVKFQGDIYLLCETCNHPMKSYKNIISSAICVNELCVERKDDTKNESMVQQAHSKFPSCQCGDEFAISVRGKNISMFCKRKQCKDTHGVGICGADAIVYF